MTQKQLKNLKERRDEIITVAMGRCWHKWERLDEDTYKCKVCSTIGNAIKRKFIEPLNTNFSTPEGWFELYHWLTKEMPNDYNLADLFVQWLTETETGWWEECKYCNGTGMFTGDGYKTQCFCGGGKILTPLGKLMKEVLEC